MKIAIIGCGNMGGAIARGLAADAVFASEHTIAVSNRTQPKLDAIKAEYPQIETSTDNCQAAAAADIVVIAVKPWLIDSVAEGLRPVLTAGQTIVSVVAGVPFSHLRELFGTATLFRVIPNTAIAIGESMTVIADDGAVSGQLAVVTDIFNRLGETLVWKSDCLTRQWRLARAARRMPCATCARRWKPAWSSGFIPVRQRKLWRRQSRELPACCLPAAHIRRRR